MIFIKFVILIVKFVIVFSSSIFSKFVEIRAMREHFEYKMRKYDVKHLIVFI